ncbi:TetR/AcrR family transcriptional regulator [Mangrovicoccus sp. HB161399]|uniref:TetR/AcrR family transcriptional regulator n=1 Tax=Mangrovicoccus sp. HB161399 TaxID=2720392 RepID=UPI00155693B8|nr:TetR family transcriptional regulator [Mangrovicoccus sp. HB161399]
MVRNAQKERTRKAILDGARTLMAEGLPVTVAAAAERHGISKATAYRYFSDPAMLAAEAGLDLSVLPYEEITAGAADLRGRLQAVTLYFFDLALANEPAFRRFLGMALTSSAAESGGAKIRRGGRRMAMYERALAEGGTGMAEAERGKLARMLTASTGAEAMVALLDVADAGPETARETVADVTDILLDRFLGPKEG